MTEIMRTMVEAAWKTLRTPLKRFLNLVDPPVIVLVYHRVTTLARDPELLAVTPEHFRAQMRYLKEHVPLVRFAEAGEAANGPAVAVTFDDGYADNVLEALPILEEVEVPATFFVSTGTIGTARLFWWDELDGLIMGRRDIPVEFTLQDDRFGRSWHTVTVNDRQEFYRQLVALMKMIKTERRERWLDQLRSWGEPNGAASSIHRAMTVPELQQLARSRFSTIGAHSVSHSRLASLTTAAQREEMVASKRQLEAWLGREIEFFSYPYGRRSDYNARTAALCREAGFVKAAANFPGQAHRWTDPYRIPRLLVRDWPVGIFAEKLGDFRTR